MIHSLNKETFLQKVFNYEESKEWKFNGTVPAIVDFYADWCDPCKILALTLKQISEEYKGKLTIYKVNTEEERELTEAFGIRSLPSILFCPINNEEPQMAYGALPKMQIEEIIANILKIVK